MRFVTHMKDAFLWEGDLEIQFPAVPCGLCYGLVTHPYSGFGGLGVVCCL